eukprot:1158728-Pelagomonas_calceolata.AAC.11
MPVMQQQNSDAMKVRSCLTCDGQTVCAPEKLRLNAQHERIVLKVWKKKETKGCSEVLLAPGNSQGKAAWTPLWTSPPPPPPHSTRITGAR